MRDFQLKKDVHLLYDYIQTKVLPLYDQLDPAHGSIHIMNVMVRSVAMSNFLSTNNEIVLTAAAYHDIGMLFDRSQHEIISGKMFRQDHFMQNCFSNFIIQQIAEAIEDHRSSKNKKPRSIYGKILHDTDTFGGNTLELMTRCLDFGRKYFPEYTKSQHFDRLYDYLNQKYGEDGYAILYIDYPAHRQNFCEIKKMLMNRKDMEQLFNSIY